MPKMKTHSGAKKRFKVTGSGRLRRSRARSCEVVEFGLGLCLLISYVFCHWAYAQIVSTLIIKLD